ncbi:flavin reductase family protein [Dyella sp.]|jgi:flavin reductase (DIM6/NTAB) family NADH-FMN oxidoreductase RutF|uniref:flavin reductase family protein n=1 Tax=Dyella sp. TaxID=1869338 RepID=UPI002D76AED9|nr:flavin reductase family protein [Dyella sp.]HET6433829.1 flavin reductase family protein [Dyella sp.]
MQLDFAELTADEAYRWLASTVTPRPIAWVSTVSKAGVSNLAPYSFFQVVCDEPPTLMLSVGRLPDGRLKDSLVNARDSGQLIIHLVSQPLAESMNATAATLPHDVSEIDQLGLSTVAGDRVAVPRLRAAPVAFECEVAEIKPYPAHDPRHFLIFARVLLAHVDDAMLADPRHVDPAKLDLVGRLSGPWYATTRDRFGMKRPP